MSLCPTLRKVVRDYVKFDPCNAEHLEAFKMLCLGESEGAIHKIKQHPTLRFELEDNFVDVRSLMFHRVGVCHLLNVEILKRAAGHR